MDISMINRTRTRFPAKDSRGFTAVEMMVASVIFPIIVIGIANAYNALNNSYRTARQLNEMYAVLSACPEIDRALEFSSLSAASNCYPNNTFAREHDRGGTSTYGPTVTVNDTSSLATGNPLKSIPDAKVINIDVAFPPPTTASNMQLRMVITRNGIGQL